jgi:hypothetical protein
MDQELKQDIIELIRGYIGSAIGIYFLFEGWI